MVTKGVDSVRSNVRNLQDFSPDVTHDRFVNAVAKEFTDFYGGDGIVSTLYCFRLSLLFLVSSHARRSGGRPY